MSRDVNPFEPWRSSGFEPRRGEADGEEQLPSAAGGPRTLRRLLLLLLVLGVSVAVAFLRLPAGHAARVWATAAALALGMVLAVAPRRWNWSVRLAAAVGAVGVAALAWLFVPTAGGLSLWSAHARSEELLDQLHALKPGDAAGFLKESADRQSLTDQFPEFAAPLEEAENSWLRRSGARWEKEFKDLAARDVPGLEKLRDRHSSYLNKKRFRAVRERLVAAERDWTERSVRAWVGDLEQLDPGKVAAFERLRESYVTFSDDRLNRAELDWLVRSCRGLEPGDFKGLARLRRVAPPEQRQAEGLRSAEAVWAQRTAAVVLVEVNPLLKSDPARASTRLRQAARDLEEFPAARDLLRPARRKALTAQVDATYRQVYQLVTADPTRNRSREVAAAADRLVADLDAEARALGLDRTLNDFRKKCEFLAKLSRSAARDAGAK
jgi:hypothetical protein